MSKLTKVQLSIVLILLSLVAGGTVHSQTSFEEKLVEPEVAELDTITVFAQQGATKLLIPLAETPQSVSIINQEDIKRQGAKSVQQATSYVSGVFSNQVGASNRFDYVVLRGFSDGSLGNTYVNGLKLLGDTNSHSSLVIDPWFLDRLEVVRGPSSVLYGQSSPGGIVAMETRKAERAKFGEIELGLGSHHYRHVAFDWNSMTDDETVAWRLTGKTHGSNNQVNQIKAQRYTLMPSLAWHISPSTRLDLMAYIQREPEGGYHSGLPYEGTVVPYYGKKISRSFYEGEKDYEKYSRHQTMLGYQFEHWFNDNISFRQSMQYMRSTVNLEQVYAFGWASPTSLNRYYSGSHERLNALTFDNQFEFLFNTGDVEHRLLTGVDYQRRKNDVSWPSGAFPTLDAFNPVYGSKPTAMYPALEERHKLDQTGVYIQDLMAWNNWRLTLGGRYDKVNLNSTNLLTNVASKIGKAQWSGRAALMYLSDSGLAPYISYSTAFTPTNFVDSQGDLLKPMQGKQWEVGLKYQPEGSSSLFSLSVFDIKQKDVATKEQPTDPYRAIGKIGSKGVEVEANLLLTDQLRLLGTYSYNTIRYIKSDDGNEGNRAVYAPRQMASLWLDYHHTGRLQGLSTSIGLRHVKGIKADRANTHTLPSYSLVDLAVSYDFSALGAKGLNARLNVQNVFDKRYVAACNSLEFCYYGSGRNMSLTVGYKF